MTTTQDFERLSAFLDNQLPPAERAALETRLAAEPELRATLRELRLTVGALRTLPAVKLPRSFTLTPAQVGAVEPKARRGPLFPVLRFATALSAVALVVVLAGDIGGGLLSASVRQDTFGGEAEVASVTMTEAVEEVAPAEAPVPSETPPSDVETLAGAGADEGTSTADDADAIEETSLLAPEADMTETPVGAADRTVEPTAEPSPKGLDPTPTPIVVAEAPPDATDLYYSTDVTTSDGALETQVANEPPPGLSPVRVIELALVMLTVLLGAAVWFARRNA